MRRALLCLVLFACTPPARPTPVAKTAAAPPPVSAPASAPPLPPPAPAARTVPELAFEPLRVNDKPLRRVFAIEGATIVTTENVVGYIDGDRVEWIAKVPRDRSYGRNVIVHVDGKYLDRIDVIMESDNGRANAPIWLPLTGKGTLHDETFGGLGEMAEARIGDSVLIVTHSGMNNDRITTVRGPTLTRRFVGAKDCKGSFYGQAYVQAHINELAAVRASAFQSTASGTLVSIGDRCGENDPYAEVWPAGSTTSRLVSLGAYWKRVGYYRTAAIRDGQDGLWIRGSEVMPLLHFQNGAFERQPGPDAPVGNVFLSNDGRLHVRAADEILRLDATGTWEVVARLASAPARITDLVMDSAGRLWAADEKEVYRLRETKQVPAERPCPGWLVALTDDNPNSSAPERAALEKVVADYPKQPGLKLVTRRSYPWMSAVSFATRAEAEAFAAYAAAALPKEKPATFCHVFDPE